LDSLFSICAFPQDLILALQSVFWGFVLKGNIEMIRFIDLKDQILEYCPMFAWYDTIADSFLEFSGNQTWESWEEFTNDYNDERDIPKSWPLKRFKTLINEKKGGFKMALLKEIKIYRDDPRETFEDLLEKLGVPEEKWKEAIALFFNIEPDSVFVGKLCGL